MTEFLVRSLSPALGAEVVLDLSNEVDEASLQRIEQLYRSHHLLLFRDQSLSEADQVRFARRFGPISHRNPAQGERESVMVSNIEPGGVLGQGELFFHSDNTFFAEPLKAIGLYAIEVPEEGGDTLFSNAFKVYDLLPDALKAKLEGLFTYQVFDYEGDYNRRPNLQTVPADAPRAIHPLVWTDPDSGRRAVFLSEHTTARILDLPETEEEELIATLRGYIADPGVAYRHRWRPGDFLFWDNIALQHARTPFDPAAHRTLRRTPVLDPDGARRFPATAQANLAGASAL